MAYVRLHSPALHPGSATLLLLAQIASVFWFSSSEGVAGSLHNLDQFACLCNFWFFSLRKLKARFLITHEESKYRVPEINPIVYKMYHMIISIMC